MLQLDSSRWSELHHAYGSAEDVPGMLARLTSSDREALSDLFGSIAHQGSVYSASIAATPHLVEIAGEVDDPNLAAEILALVGTIAVGDAPGLVQSAAEDVRVAYQSCLPKALQAARATLLEPLDPVVAVYLLQAAAALNGFSTLGTVLVGFIDKEFCIECPACERELFVWPTEDGFTTAAEDPVFEPKTARAPMHPGPTVGSPHEAEFRWLNYVGGPAALSLIGSSLPYLFGSGTCPACKRSFVLRDELVNRNA
jgi:hypothetical protein